MMTVLVANRGEIARRIFRTAKRMGLRTVAVYSDADAGAPFVREADIAIRIGAAPARDSYLNIPSIVAAAREANATLIHPGYGFLSARAAFGDERLILERAVERPRHVEIQLLADTHGTVITLGERDCSAQRRHQKVLEESPSPAVDPALRKTLSAAATAIAKAVGYVN